MTREVLIEEYLADLPEPPRADVKRLHELICKVAPHLKPALQGKIIGYGSYHYVYASGREGDAAVIGLAGRAHGISLYVMCTSEGQYIAEKYKPQLPKASIGKSCIRFKRLSDVDLDVLERLIKEGSAFSG